jgi:hypothetical protein
VALDVWFKLDIQNALRAAEQASGAALRAADNEHNPYVEGFQAGYRAALTTIALAFNLLPIHSEPGTQAGHLAGPSVQPRSGLCKDTGLTRGGVGMT